MKDLCEVVCASIDLMPLEAYEPARERASADALESATAHGASAITFTICARETSANLFIGAPRKIALAISGRQLRGERK
jgi:hypothetical protein